MRSPSPLTPPRVAVPTPGWDAWLVTPDRQVAAALKALLAVEALGSANVLALKMPYRTSSPESLLHADAVIARASIAALPESPPSEKSGSQCST